MPNDVGMSPHTMGRYAGLQNATFKTGILAHSNGLVLSQL